MKMEVNITHVIRQTMIFRLISYPNTPSKEEVINILQDGKKVKFCADNWTADVFAGVYSAFRLDPNKYEEVKAEIFEVN